MRRIGLVAIVALLAAGVSGVSAAPAGAAPTSPVAGTMFCALGGSASVRPALKSTPAVGKVALHGTGIVASPCDISQVTGGKGTEFVQARTMLSAVLAPGAACAAGPLAVTKVSLTIKIYVLNLRSGKPVLDAALRPQVTSLEIAGTDLVLAGTLPQNGAGTMPFGGEAFGATIPIGNASQLTSCEIGTGSLSSITFGGGASLTVAPPCVGPISTSLQLVNLGTLLWVVVVPTSSSPLCMPSGTIQLSNFASGNCGALLDHGSVRPLVISPIAGTGANAGEDLMGILVATGSNVGAFEAQCEPFGAHYSGDGVFGAISKVL